MDGEKQQLLWRDAPSKSANAKQKEKERQELVEKTDFLSIGTHCCVKTCKQLDFLPYTCHRCKAVTCHDHRNDHNCANPIHDKQVPRCPVCSQYLVNAVKDKQTGKPMSVDAIVDKHIASGCKSHLLEAAEKKKAQRTPRCRAKGCKQALQFPIACRTCHQHYCAKHRFPEDHSCSTVQQQQRQQQRQRPQPRHPTACGTAAASRVRESWLARFAGFGRAS
ncbi:hypothetical protein PTSG_00987 [Salpingoeca rosetta]|uniref:AN1-type domain-containing protein n=1 Tax=Salpingoeca rosetta (strain ATCC 50818 / BSB-021) TaxID=946362 RepID=F2TY25_SALR5|nr:uncharacterized protein PTSG_00987 [Salpingoeca rosetta]EGD76284.1 hypothetical protein PTSG_00987 [Salpingoeca rosetta]|eukprot:XP_004998459.1 hypothetical protein PTSG_00987 [Salpingoeca rosetta]